ncbi:MAG: alpha/beta fold hydrolase [Moraxellaceae bacterium]|nr:alpha/beta fold hydrolase [Pseudobdellovibrionaceae bacterium]
MITLEPFKASPFFFHSHLQTIFGEIFGSSPKITHLLQSFEVNLPDGDQLICEHLPGSSQTVSLLCHGLTGDSRSSYLLRTAEHLKTLGHHVVLMNHRNCGLGFGKASRPYHSGSGADIGEVIFALRQKFPETKIILFGYSLSANASLRLLCEPEILFKNQIDRYLPDAAFIANPPINLSRASDLLGSGINQVYEKFFVRGLNQLLRKQIHTKLINPDRLDLKYFNSNMRIKEFDNRYTSIYSGFQNADDYYEKCSTYKKVEKIKIPTLILTSDDDSFVDVQDFKNLAPSPTVQVLITRGGGHLGYISSRTNRLGSYRWLDYAAVEFAKQIFT